MNLVDPACVTDVLVSSGLPHLRHLPEAKQAASVLPFSEDLSPKVMQAVMELSVKRVYEYIRCPQGLPRRTIYKS
jgi:hypothetical protein